LRRAAAELLGDFDREADGRGDVDLVAGAGGAARHCSFGADRHANDRRIGNDRKLGVVHNLGGYPGEMVSFVSVVGTEQG